MKSKNEGTNQESQNNSDPKGKNNIDGVVRENGREGRPYSESPVSKNPHAFISETLNRRHPKENGPLNTLDGIEKSKGEGAPFKETDIVEDSDFDIDEKNLGL